MGMKRWPTVGALFALAVLLTACGSGATDRQAGETAPAGGAAATQQAGQARRGGTLVVALDNNPKNFDPMLTNDVASNAVVANVVEGLYKYDQDLKPVPWLAERVEQPDDRTYVFHLRRGVKFHDGTEMDAEAVRFSIDRIRENKTSPRFRDGQDIAESVVLDQYTYKIVLKDAFAPFPTRLTGGLGAIVSPAAVRAMGDEKFTLNPVGTGPFKFGEWKSDNYVRVEKWGGYWRPGADERPVPYLDAVEWRIITEPSARLTALQAGDVQVIEGGRMRDADLALVKKDSGLVYKQQPGFSYKGMYLTINKPPFDNKALRQAVAYAIDREEIVRAVYDGNRAPAYGPMPTPLAWATDENFKPYGHDPQKAKQKLAEGGSPTGFEFEYWIAAGDSQEQALAELIQVQLSRVGIKMTIQSADANGVLVPKLQKGETNAYQIGISGGLDPDEWVSGAYRKGGGFNFFPYDNPRVEELILQGRRTTNLDQRATTYKEIVRLVLEESPYIFTNFGVDRFVGSTRVQGWTIGPALTAGYANYWLKG